MKNKVIKQTLSAIATIFIIICLLFISIFYTFIAKDIERFLNKDVFQVSHIVKSAMETSVNSEKTIERLVDEKLYFSSVEIAKELRGKKIEEISQMDLINLKYKLGLYDISLLVRDGDDIVVAQSSSSNEIGLSTKKWGYWFVAFNELLSRKPVSVNKGFYKENYWAGPISRSEWDNNFFKYAYYFDGTTQFLINPYLLDKDIYRIVENANPNSMIDNMTKSSNIDEIAVINIGALKNVSRNIVIEPGKTLPILYGENTHILKRDIEYYQKVLQENKIYSSRFTWNHKKYKKFYIPIKKDKVLVIVSDLSQKELLLTKLMTIFVASILVAFVIIFIVLQFVTKKYLKPIEMINSHINRIATGDFTAKLTIEKNNEFGDISTHLNKMSDQISLLISEVKTEIESLIVVSALLTKMVNSYFRMMEQVSSTMTLESRELFYEIDLQVEELQKNVQQVKQELSCFTSINDNGAYSELLLRSSQQIIQLNHLMKDNIEKITVMNLSSYEALKELNNIIHQIDNLSKNLENKIKIFKIHSQKEM